MAKYIHQLLLSTHRILGTALSILFAMWFLSGLVMIYHTFPRVSPADRRAKMECLEAGSLPAWEDVARRVPEGEKIVGVTLDRYLGQTVFHIRTDRGAHDIPAEAGDSLPQVDSLRIRQVAALWCDAPVERVDTLRALDQWIPFGSLKREFPIYKFHFQDDARHELYISSRTGAVLQLTDRGSRFWAWLGAIPHWVYFTSLRQDAQLWIKTVVWLSGIGCVMCIAGIYLGIRDFRLARRRRLLSPYKRFWYKWHHIVGTVFGLFVLTFCFSGMMSLANVQDWGIRPKLPFSPVAELRKLSPAPAYPLDYREVIARYPDEIRQMEWGNFGPIPFYNIYKEGKTETIDARRADDIRPLALAREDILPVIESIHGNSLPVHIESIDSYDTYYLTRKHPLEFPVWKITIPDADHSCYFVNPRNGRVKYVNDPARAMHWMYPALHSLNVKFLVEHPVLWNIVMWTLMLGGTFVSLSGVYLAFKYLKRKLKKK